MQDEVSKLRDKFIDDCDVDDVDGIKAIADLPIHEWIQDLTPVRSICKLTERLLWHQRLGHPSDSYLYTAHKYIDGVPKFKHQDPVLEQCPTCIRSEQPKTPGRSTTMKATRPFQGWSCDMAFSGMVSKNDRRKDYVGLHGETCWILFKDHFTGYLFGRCQKTKGTPLNWIRDLLNQYCPGNG